VCDFVSQSFMFHHARNLVNVVVQTNLDVFQSEMTPNNDLDGDDVPARLDLSNDHQLARFVWSICGFHAVMTMRSQIGPGYWRTDHTFTRSDLSFALTRIHVRLDATIQLFKPFCV
jgi:hypothetical protein